MGGGSWRGHGRDFWAAGPFPEGGIELEIGAQQGPLLVVVEGRASPVQGEAVFIRWAG